LTKQKLARILAIVALCFIGVFTATLIMSFIGFGGITVLAITIASAVIGLVLFAIIKRIQKNKDEVSDVSVEEKDAVFPTTTKKVKDGEAELLD